LRRGVVFEEGELAGQAHERLPRLGGADRFLAHHEHAAQLLLERFDPLADCRGGHAQHAGCSVERARVDDGGEGLELVALRFHHQQH
jgi:hypothetical protein